MKCHVALQRHKGISKKIEIPRSIPGLVTRRLLVMNFLDGLQITRLGDKTKKLSHKKRKIAVERIVHRVAEAYGRQLLYGGLFQADGHPGNILVMKGTHVLLCLAYLQLELLMFLLHMLCGTNDAPAKVCHCSGVCKLIRASLTEVLRL